MLTFVSQNYNIQLKNSGGKLTPEQVHTKIRMDIDKIHKKQNRNIVEKTVNNDATTKFPKSLIEEKPKTFDIDNICLKSNEKYISYSVNDKTSTKIVQPEPDDNKQDTKQSEPISANEHLAAEKAKRKATPKQYFMNVRIRSTEKPRIVPAGPVKNIVQYLDKLDGIKTQETDTLDDRSSVKLEMYDRIDRKKSRVYTKLISRQIVDEATKPPTSISEHKNILDAIKLNTNEEPLNKIRQHKTNQQVMQKKYKNLLDNYVPKESDPEPVAPAAPLKKERFEQIFNLFKCMDQPTNNILPDNVSIQQPEPKEQVKQYMKQAAMPPDTIKDLNNNKMAEEANDQDLNRNSPQVITEKELMRELKSRNTIKTEKDEENSSLNSTKALQLKDNLIAKILTKIKLLQELTMKNPTLNSKEIVQTTENNDDKINKTKSENNVTEMKVNLPNIQESPSKDSQRVLKQSNVKIVENANLQSFENSRNDIKISNAKTIKHESVDSQCEKDNSNKLKTKSATSQMDQSKLLQLTNKFPNKVLSETNVKIVEHGEIGNLESRRKILNTIDVTPNKIRANNNIENKDDTSSIKTNFNSIQQPTTQSAHKISNEKSHKISNEKSHQISKTKNLENRKKEASIIHSNILSKRKTGDPHDELEDPEIIVVETEKTGEEGTNMSDKFTGNRPTIRRDKPPPPPVHSPTKPSQKKIPPKGKKDVILPPQKPSDEAKLANSKSLNKVTTTIKEDTSNQTLNTIERKPSFFFQYLLTRKEPLILSPETSEKPGNSTEINTSALKRNQVYGTKNINVQNIFNSVKKPTLITENQKLSFQNPNQVVSGLNINGNKEAKPDKHLKETKSNPKEKCKTEVLTKSVLETESNANEKYNNYSLAKKPIIMSDKQKLSFSHSAQSEEFNNNIDKTTKTNKRNDNELKSLRVNSNVTVANNHESCLVSQKYTLDNSMILLNNVSEDNESKNIKEINTSAVDKKNVQNKEQTKLLYSKLKSTTKVDQKRPQTTNSETYSNKELMQNRFIGRSQTANEPNHFNRLTSTKKRATSMPSATKNITNKKSVEKIPSKNFGDYCKKYDTLIKNDKFKINASDSKLLQAYMLEENEQIEKEKNLSQIYMLDEDEAVDQNKINKTNVYPKLFKANQQKKENLLQGSGENILPKEADKTNNSSTKNNTKTSNISVTNLKETKNTVDHSKAKQQGFKSFEENDKNLISKAVPSYNTNKSVETTENSNSLNMLAKKTNNHINEDEMLLQEKKKTINVEKSSAKEDVNNSTEKTNKLLTTADNVHLNAQETSEALNKSLDKLPDKVQSGLSILHNSQESDNNDKNEDVNKKQKIILKIILPKAKKELEISIGKRDEINPTEEIESETKKPLNLEKTNANDDDVVTEIQKVGPTVQKTTEINTQQQQSRSLTLSEPNKPKYLLESSSTKKYQLKALEHVEINNKQNILQSHKSDSCLVAVNTKTSEDVKPVEYKNLKYVIAPQKMNYKYLVDDINNTKENLSEPDLSSKAKSTSELNLQNQTKKMYQVTNIAKNTLESEVILRQQQMLDKIESKKCKSKTGKETIQSNVTLSEGPDKIIDLQSNIPDNSVAKTVSKIFIYLLKSRNKMQTDIFERKSREDLHHILQKYKLYRDDITSLHEQRLSFADLEMFKKKNQQQLQKKIFEQKFQNNNSTNDLKFKIIKPIATKKILTSTNKFDKIAKELYKHQVKKDLTSKSSSIYLLEYQLSSEFIHRVNKEIANQELQNKYNSSRSKILFTNKKIDFITDYSHKYLLFNQLPSKFLDQFKKQTKNTLSSLCKKSDNKKVPRSKSKVEYDKSLKSSKNDTELSSITAEICEILPKNMFKKLHYKEQMYRSIFFGKSLYDVRNLDHKNSKDRIKHFNKKLFDIVVSNSGVNDYKTYQAENSEIKTQKCISNVLPKKVRNEKYYSTPAKSVESNQVQLLIEKGVSDSKPTVRKSKEELCDKFNMFSSLYIPLKNLSHIIFSRQNEEVTTLNKRRDERIIDIEDVEPKQASMLEKYKGLKITYIEVKKPISKEVFESKERNHVLNKRFQLLKDLFTDYVDKETSEKFDTNTNRVINNNVIKTKPDSAHGDQIDKEKNDFSKTIEQQKEVSNATININPDHVPKTEIEVFIKKLQKQDSCKEKKDGKEGEEN